MNARSKVLAAAGRLGLTLTGSIAAGSTPALAKSDVYSAWYGNRYYSGYGLGPLGALSGGLIAPAPLSRPARVHSYDSHPALLRAGHLLKLLCRHPDGSRSSLDS
jgi:hypothetical protein